MVLRMTKQYLPAFQPSKQVRSDLVRARKSLIFPSFSESRTVEVLASQAGNTGSIPVARSISTPKAKFHPRKKSMAIRQDLREA